MTVAGVPACGPDSGTIGKLKPEWRGKGTRVKIFLSIPPSCTRADGCNCIMGMNVNETFKV